MCKLKVLHKITCLTKTIISLVVSQRKNDVTEASIAILNKNNRGRFFHCWQSMSASIASFN